MENMEFDYFYGSENEQYLFIQIPLMLIRDAKFKNLSNDAKILYSLMLDMTKLSNNNGWRDEQGRAYIIYTQKQIMSDLNCHKEKVSKTLKELIEFDLLESKFVGLGQPNRMYVKNLAVSILEKNLVKW